MVVVWKPARTSGVAVYVQIAEHIKNLINYGYLKPGTRLSIRKCAAEYGASDNTVIKAFKYLESAGALHSKSCSGAFVAESAWCRVIHNASDWDRIASCNNRITNGEIFSEGGQRSHNKESIKFSGYSLNYELFKPQEPLPLALESFRSIKIRPDEMFLCDRYGFYDLHCSVVKYGIETEVENVVVFNSLAEASTTAMHARLNSNMNLFVLENDILSNMGGILSICSNVHNISFDNKINFDTFRSKLSRNKNSMLSLSCVNHYPTGHTFSSGEREELLEICLEMEIPVIDRLIQRSVDNGAAAAFKSD